jgi:hypothetical protein
MSFPDGRIKEGFFDHNVLQGQKNKIGSLSGANSISSVRGCGKISS